MDAEQIADKARRSISKYCYEECKAFCCRNGYLVLTRREVNKVTQGKKEEMLRDGLLKELKDGKFSQNMGEGGCQSLEDFKCQIHKSKFKPKACHEFPIFIRGKTVMLSTRCPAVKEGKLYPYVRQLAAMGLNIAERNYFSEMELYKLKDKFKA